MRFPTLPMPLPVARAFIDARRRMLNVADAGMPGAAALSDLVFGLQRTKLAGTLVSSGLADAVGNGARAPVDLARELELDPDVTTRIVNAAVASRLMHLDEDGRASLTKMGAPLCRDHPNSIASWVAFLSDADTAAAYGHMDIQLREGGQQSGFAHTFGKSLWNHFGDRPALGATFADAMRQLTAFDLAGIVRAYPWPRRGVMCDVAGGVGHLLAAILERRPRARGILLDSPDVIEQADGFLRGRGMDDRIDRREGDLFGELDARADVYTMKWILHDWGDDACRGILTRLRATMPSGAKVVTIDPHHERTRPDGLTPMMDLLMLVCCEGGRERSPQEVHALMRDAGLKPGRVRHAGVMMLVEASPRDQHRADYADGMRIALAQIQSGTDPRANLKLVEDYTRRAADAGATMVLFPESTMCRFGVSLSDIAQPLDGPWADGVRRAAASAGVTVIAGMFVPADDGRVTNTLIASGPDVDTHYDKIYLYDAFGFTESRTVAPGHEPVVITVDGVRVGLSLCYDIRFPELYVELAQRGAQLITVHASWGTGPGKLEQWTLLARARALDTGSLVAAVGQAYPGDEIAKVGPTGVGGSVVASPLGEVIESAGADPQLLITDVDPATVEPVRDTIAVLRNRTAFLGGDRAESRG